MEDIDSILAQYGLQGMAANDEAVEAMQPANQSLSEESPQESETTTEDTSDDIFDEVLTEHGFVSADETLTDPSEDIAPSDETDGSDPQEIVEAVSEDNEEPAPTTTPSDDALLSTNSPTLLLDDATSRFSGAEWYNEIQKAKVIIGGMGGISSHLVFNIARMSPAIITMYDDDTVETANMSGQLYSRNDVGLSKVDAMLNMLQQYTTASSIYAVCEKFTPNSEPGDIMLCGFDNMMARKIFFQVWKKHVESLPTERRAKCLFMDGRLSLTVMQIFCITGDDEYSMQRYQEKYLFNDSEADETVCSMKQTTYLASMIGATMTNLFTNFIANTLEPLIPYTLPFLTEYDAQYMIFKTEN